MDRDRRRVAGDLDKGVNQEKTIMTTIPLSQEPVTAEECFQILRALRERLPEPPAIEPALTSGRLAHVDVNFVHATVNAAGASEGVQKALNRTPENMRGEIDERTRWNAAMGELRAIYKVIGSTNTVRSRRIGLTAMQTFKICQQLARDPANAALESHIEEMKRLNKFGRKRARRAQPVPAPAPAPEPAMKTP
jgi:hypothetical protein